MTFPCPVGVLNFQKSPSPVSLTETPTPVYPGKVLNVASNRGFPPGELPSHALVRGVHTLLVSETTHIMPHFNWQS